MPWRMPPKCEAICLVQLNGVSNAHVQRHGHVIVGLVGAPGIVEVLQLGLDGNLDAVELATSFGVPISVPSALEPLSPLM